MKDITTRLRALFGSVGAYRWKSKYSTVFQIPNQESKMGYHLVENALKCELDFWESG